MIVLDSVNKFYQQADQKISLLENASHTFSLGEKVAIVGPSGSGKTTLLSVIAGFENPSSGNVFFGEQDIYSLQGGERQVFRQENIGFVFQNFELLSALTVLENVMLPLDITEKYSSQEAEKRAKEMLEKVGMSHRLSSYPSMISGGEAQRVAVARALVHNPRYVFADEPTGNLDQENSKAITQLLCDTLGDNALLLLITHDMEVAKQMDRMMTIHEKKLIDFSL